MNDDSKIFKEVEQHYQMWTNDNDERINRKGGWNDVTDAYYGKLPDDWPYISRIVDPRIRTSLNEKNGRLLNAKLKGRMVPREGGDTVGAAINNALLDYQWDTANYGGSMQIKMSVCDMDTRLYQSKFALVWWRYIKNEEGEVLFEGNEMTPLDIRDCGMDSTASHIRDAKWFQMRQWVTIEELESRLNAYGEPVYKNLDVLKKKLKDKLTKKRSSTRTTEYVPRVTQLRGLEDRTGEDLAFPVFKIVHEFREDKCITFAPDYSEIILEDENPYEHGKIPIAQLRYSAIQDDPLGESEVEPVIPLWTAIQATVCSYMDEVILKMRPPLKIIEGAARIETIEYGPEAQWLMDRPDAVTEMQSTGDSLRYFQTTYQALVSAFNTAMGDFSQGISNFGPFESGDKTATEIKTTERQQNVRDQKDQNNLGEFIKDIMSMWLKNNQQFLFSDPTKVEHIIRIVGEDQYNRFKRAGMDQLELPPESAQMIADVIQMTPDMTDEEIQDLVDTASVPRHPVVMNPKEKDPSKYEVKPKMRMMEDGQTAELSLVPEDLQGAYDYVPDVKSMSIGAGEELAYARQQAIQLFTSNPTVIQLLAEDGHRPNVKELITSTLEGLGLKDAQRFISKIETQSPSGQMGGVAPNSPVGGLQGVPQANTGGGIPQQMGGPSLGGDLGAVL